jgi:Raf kinase inhibitor-like YbhB/YbcL family protein
MRRGNQRGISAGARAALICGLWGVGTCTAGCAGRGAQDQTAEAPGAFATRSANGASTVGELLEPNRAPATLRVTLPTAATGELPTESSAGVFGCTGKNVSPGIEWQGAPAGTKSFAVIMHDPDAPTGVGFFHWTLFDIPSSASKLSAGASPRSLPAGSVEGYTDYGASGYGGPCPPPGPAHRYVVTVYAVDVPTLGVPASSTAALLRFLLRDHTLALGRAVAMFGRRETGS